MSRVRQGHMNQENVSWMKRSMILESKCPLQQEDLSNTVSEWHDSIERIRDMGQFEFLVTFSTQEELKITNLTNSELPIYKLVSNDSEDKNISTKNI
jgi:hypothetical protein